MLERIEKTREHLDDAGVKAFYVTGPENLIYLSGFSGSTGALLLHAGKPYLLTDFRYIEQAGRECPGFEIIEVKGSYPEALLDIVKKNDFSPLGCEGEHLTYNQFSAFKAKLAGIELKPLSGVVEAVRLCKDENEIQSIVEAVRLADEAFREILPVIRTGVSEQEIALRLEYFMRRMGADKTAFDTIVASGPRSALPHGVASSRVIQEGDLVTMDFGAVYCGYHSDITRTIVMGRPQKKQEDIYSIVLEAQMKAISVLRAGVKASDVDRAARDIIEHMGYGEYFGHGTGHGVGLSIHENPSLSLKDDTVLKAGMVVTIEPGIYLPGWGGIRIEDTVLVEDNGCRVLTRSPKEKLMVLS